MPLGGITAGTQSILGYNYGAGNTKRIAQAFRSIILLCLVFCGVMFAIAQTVSGSFVRIFTKDPAYIDMASYMIRTYSLGVLGLAVQYPAVDGMTGMGLIRWGLTFSMLRKGLFLVCVFRAAAAVRRDGRHVLRADFRHHRRGRVRLRSCLCPAEAAAQAAGLRATAGCLPAGLVCDKVLSRR